MEAVLICNGLSANGYESPNGAYVLTINDGFKRHRADGVFSVDCPTCLRESWADFHGDRVTADHVSGYPYKSDLRYPCLDMVQKFSSSTPCALGWLAEVKKFKSVSIVGLDSLWGAGKPGASYCDKTIPMIEYMSQYFPDGLYVERNGRRARVGSDEFSTALMDWRDTPLDVGGGATEAPAGIPPPRAEKSKPCPSLYRPTVCAIPQTMVEFDVSPRCTRSCDFCAPGIPAARRKQKKGLSLAAHNAVIDELSRLGYSQPTRWLCYCGHGEPLLATKLGAMIKYARRTLPDVKIAVYTNTDCLRVDFACLCQAQGVRLILDIYDAESGPAAAEIIAASSLNPDSVHVVDHVATKPTYSSRCASVCAGQAAAWANRPCAMPEGKLFITDNGKGEAAALLCCEDYQRESLTKLTTIDSLVKESAPIRQALAAGNRAGAAPICSKCDRDGGHPSGFGHVPILTKTKYWPPSPTAPKLAVPGKRLVVLATDLQWSKHAATVLDAIAAASTVPGETILIWNGAQSCPEALRRDNVTVWEYPAPLGWKGISRGFARAFEYAVKGKFDWTIKLDTDTAILSKGWDAALCNDCPRDAQAGTYMDAAITGQFPNNRDTMDDGLFNGQLHKLPWSSDYVERGLRKWDHMQGGCYILGLDALKRIDYVTGLDADDQDAVQEVDRIGEDVYIDTKCKIARVPQKETLRARIWFRAGRSDSIFLHHIRYQRDALGVVVCHPVKDINALRMLVDEITKPVCNYKREVVK